MEQLEDSEHTDTFECWCHPELILQGEPGKFGDVCVHKGHGEELAPAWVIAAAIASAFVQEES